MTAEDRVIQAIGKRALTKLFYEKAYAKTQEAKKYATSVRVILDAGIITDEARDRWHVASAECDEAMKTIELLAIARGTA